MTALYEVCHSVHGETWIKKDDHLLDDSRGDAGYRGQLGRRGVSIISVR